MYIMHNHFTKVFIVKMNFCQSGVYFFTNCKIFDLDTEVL